MELFKNTRLRIGNAILAKRVAKTSRKIFYSNISQVKSIGIIWDAGNPAEFSSLSKFYQDMVERNINVKILGYYAGKELPYQYTAIRYLNCIRKHEVNYFYLPVSSEARSFISTPFEILIEINFKEVFPIRYISSLSSATLKVGLFESETTISPFDLMLQLKRPLDIETYLRQVIVYLEMINSEKLTTIDK